MSYTTYITDALVCGSKAHNTADKSYLLFTRDAGMLYAHAKSVREERSKQRFALQEFSYIRATLVHGKTGWRVTGAEPVMNAYAIQRTREARALVRNVIRLLRRLVHGEESHPRLFEEVIEVVTNMHEAHEREIEEVFTLRALHTLGYIAPHGAVNALLEASSSREALALLDSGSVHERAAIIESALRESHL